METLDLLGQVVFLGLDNSTISVQRTVMSNVSYISISSNTQLLQDKCFSTNSMILTSVK